MCLLLLIMLAFIPGEAAADIPMTDSRVLTDALISTVDSLIITHGELHSPVLVRIAPAGTLASFPLRRIESHITAHGLSLTDSLHTAASVITLSFSDIRVIVARQGEYWKRTAILGFHLTAGQPDDTIYWVAHADCHISDTLADNALGGTDDLRQFTPGADRVRIGTDSRLPQIVSFAVLTTLLVWLAFK